MRIEIPMLHDSKGGPDKPLLVREVQIRESVIESSKSDRSRIEKNRKKQTVEKNVQPDSCFSLC
jgi:hypothetical protein